MLKSENQFPLDVTESEKNIIEFLRMHGIKNLAESMENVVSYTIFLDNPSDGGVTPSFRNDLSMVYDLKESLRASATLPIG